MISDTNPQRRGTRCPALEALLDTQLACLKTSARPPERWQYDEVGSVPLDLGSDKFIAREGLPEVACLELKGYVAGNKIVYVECTKSPGQLLKLRDPEIRKFVVDELGAQIAHKRSLSTPVALRIDTRMAEVA